MKTIISRAELIKPRVIGPNLTNYDWIKMPSEPSVKENELKVQLGLALSGLNYMSFETETKAFFDLRNEYLMLYKKRMGWTW